MNTHKKGHDVEQARASDILGGINRIKRNNSTVLQENQNQNSSLSEIPGLAHENSARAIL